VVSWIEGEDYTTPTDKYGQIWKEFNGIISEVPRGSLESHSTLVKNYLTYNSPNVESNELSQNCLEQFLILPDMEDTALIHGDFHKMNLLRTDNGIAVIDWEYACWGNPEFDLAYLYAYDLQTPRDISIEESVRALLVMAMWFIRRADSGGNYSMNFSLANRYLKKAKIHWQKF